MDEEKAHWSQRRTPVDSHICLQIHTRTMAMDMYQQLCEELSIN